MIGLIFFCQDLLYSYEWKLIAHPENDPAVTEDQTTAILHLTRLIQGSYVFQVTVKSAEATGAANVTITVNPGKVFDGHFLSSLELRIFPLAMLHFLFSKTNECDPSRNYLTPTTNDPTPDE